MTKEILDGIEFSDVPFLKRFAARVGLTEIQPQEVFQGDNLEKARNRLPTIFGDPYSLCDENCQDTFGVPDWDLKLREELRSRGKFQR